jgi:hypothetical protein
MPQRDSNARRQEGALLQADAQAMRGVPRARDSAREQRLVWVKRTHLCTQLGPAVQRGIRGVQTLATLGGDQ